MMRAAVGCWVLIVVVCGLFVGSAVLGPGEPGTALRAAPPTPPAIGSCTLGLHGDPLPSCDDEHTGEIVLSWSGTRPPTTLDPARYPPDMFSPDNPENHCYQAASDWVGIPEPIEYSPDISWHRYPPVWDVQLVTGPTPSPIEGWSWSACVLRPADAAGASIASVGSLRDLNLDPLRGRPDTWRPCVAGDPNQSFVTCAVPHRAELIAYAEIALPEDELLRLAEQPTAGGAGGFDGGGAGGGFGGDSYGPPSLDLALPAAVQECRSLIEEYLGAPLGDHQDDLRMSLTYSLLYSYAAVPQNGELGVAGMPGQPSAVSGDCRVEVIGERDLVASLADIGSGPLPFG